MRWFKMYSEVLNDRKIQSLPLDLLKGWLNLLCIANENPRRGFLPPVEDVAFALRVQDEEAAKLVEGLLKRGLLDRDKDGWVQPHNWDGRQAREEKSTERVRRHRQKARALKAEKTPPTPDPPSPKPDVTGVEQSGTCFTVPVTERRNKNGTDVDSIKTGIRGEEEERELIPNVINSPVGEDDEDDDQPEDDRPYLELAMKAGYQVVSRGHRKTIEHTRELFGDACAVAVGNSGMRIHQHLGGELRFFRAAAEWLKRTGRGRYDYVGAVLAKAKEFRSTGIPPAPVAIPDDIEVIHPRVYPSDSPSRQPAPTRASRSGAAARRLDPERFKDIS